MRQEKRYYRKTTIALSVLLAFFCALFAFLAFWWFGKSYPAFDEKATLGVKIPALGDGISPQGLCALPEDLPANTHFDFLMSGYIEGSPSRVYLISNDEIHSNKNNGYAWYATLTRNGEPIESHFGGIVCTQKYVYIASEDEVIVVLLDDLLHLPYESGAKVEIAGSFQTGFTENATCCVNENELYIAEFYHPPKYETDTSHMFEPASGVRHTLAYAYALDDNAEYGIADMVPTKALSVPDEAQGMLIRADGIYFSCSYGLASSRLVRCPNSLGGETDKTFNVNGKEIPLYIVEGSNVLTMPCMSEEICEKDGKLYMLFESSSKKYRLFVRNRISYLVSFDLSAL